MLILIFGGILLWFIFLLLVSSKWKNCKCNYKERGGGGGSTTTTSHTYYYYKIKFPHTSIDPSQSIIFYNAYGVEVYTLPSYYEFMNYGEGVLSVPGSEQNTVVEGVASATYYVFYASDNLVIDYNNAEFKIAKKLIKVTANTTVKGTFEYFSIITAFKDVASVIDGRWDTQVQTEFFAEPPTGYNYAIIDLGTTKTIQAIDIVAGFYKPDSVRKFDVDFNMTMQYSTNGTDYYDVSDKTHNFQLTGGSSVSFEEDDLGVGFQARYIKLILENIKKIEYGEKKDINGTVIQTGVYVVALTEIAAYDNIILESEATLIPMTELTADYVITGESSGEYSTTITVEDTTGFDSSGTAYLENTDGSWDVFTYTGITATQFTGVLGVSQSHYIDDRVVQEMETDTSIYDYVYSLPKLRDRVYKSNKINDNTLFSSTQLDYVAKSYIKEFVKNHSKIQVELLYSPHLEVGQTIKVVDTYNNTDTRYFIDSIRDNNGFYSIVLARYQS